MQEISHDYEKYFERRYGIVGKSQAIQDAILMLTQAAPTELTVLITGETGTGKEVFANAVHSLSNRKKNAFVSVNCGAIPENLLESELFGHEKGAFTGAHEQRKGFFEVANKGTIFLDEIGEMPLITQVKLLRILESGEFSRLGSSAIHKVDVRIIAATNRSLEDEVMAGNFRQDLYFRLKNVHIILPPLRNHVSDIPVLVEHFAKAVCEKIGLHYDGVSEDALEVLKAQPWPGNVRELKNMIETIITLEKNSYLSPDILRKYIKPSLPPHIMSNVPNNNSLVRIEKNEGNLDLELGLIFRTLLELQTEVREVKRMVSNVSNEIEDMKLNSSHLRYDSNMIPSLSNNLEEFEDKTFEEVEKILIERTLKKYNSNRRLAAEKLGVSERTLYRKINEYGLE